MPSSAEVYLERIEDMMSGADGGNGIKADVTVSVPPVTAVVDTSAVEAKIGATTDVAVEGDNVGSLSAKARGLNKDIADVHDIANHALNVNVVAGGGGGGAMTVADGADVALGTTTDAGVITDTTGTVIGFLRGIVKLIVAKLSIKVASGDIASGAVASGAIASGAVVDGALVTIGSTTTDAASSTAAEDTTARTGIGLWKAIKNILILINGKFPAAFLIPTHKANLSAVAITTAATVWDPGAGLKVRLMGGCISVSAACSVLFSEETANTVIFRTPQLLANTPYNFDLGNGFVNTTADKVLQGTASTGTVTITGTLYGKEE